MVKVSHTVPYDEVPSANYDECTHKEAFDRNETIVKKCKSKCIIECITDDECSYPSVTPYTIGQEITCDKNQYKIKICGKDKLS